MKLARWPCILSIAALAACASLPINHVNKELLPTGKLRVGIGIGASPSAFWATKDPATGEPRGVTVDLANALAKKLGAPLELVIYANSGEVVSAGPKGEWDAAFMPEDAERRRIVDFAPAYYLSTSTYMVRAGSPIRTLAEVDQPGMRVAGIASTTTARTAIATLKNTKLISYRTVDEMVAKMKAGEIDAIALGRDSLQGLQPQIPGSRILDGYFHSAGTAVAVPKNHPAALAYVTEFIEEAKASGLVRRAFDGAGMKGAPVAPPAR